jgi:zinc/manganese transport system substrate-binding protein
MCRAMVSVIVVCLVATLGHGSDPILVVTGNTVVQDLAVRIGGSRIAATCLLRPGVDPHAYQPVPEDVRRLAAARLVIINGLGFEGWFESLAREARFSGAVVVASAGITPLRMAGDGGHGHDHPAVDDPHAYNSIRHGVRYAENIRDALIAMDPEGAAGHRQRAEALIVELRQADAWATVQFAVIPKAQRTIITNHDALAYFAADYGFQVLSPDTALEDSQPGAQQIAALSTFIRAHGVRGVFLEFGKNPKLIEQIAAESGARIGAPLMLDGAGSIAEPELGYVGMFRANVRSIVEALR